MGAALVLLFGAVPAASAAPVSCAEQSSVLQCDSDDDGIVDVVEEAICGSATCATGTEDSDGDGVPDATELAASLAAGGPAGPVQLRDPSDLIVVGPDGSITELSLWPFAAGATAFLAAVALFVFYRRRVRGAVQVRAIGRHAARELT